MKPNPFVTIAEAATTLGVDERRVREMVERGVLRCVTVSERRRFLYRAEVNTHAETRRRETNA